MQAIRHPQSRPHAQGFTLIEIMVVVIIIGILAVSIIPQFMGTTNDAKISAAKANIAELESAVNRFYVHMDRYPTTEEGLKALVNPPVDGDKNWRGPYISQLRDDPWGNPFQYKSPGTHHPTSFDIWSPGSANTAAADGGGTEIGNW